METVKAKIIEREGKYFIEIETESEKITIPISEDHPNEVKKAFNKIILHIKEGGFQIELEDVGTDLFSQVANEYITQLNREIQEVRSEMENCGLVDS